MSPSIKAQPNELLLALLHQERRWTAPRRLSTVVSTVLLMDGDIEIIRAVTRGLEERRLEPDASLVKDLYEVLPKRLKLKLASSPAAFKLPPHAFDRIFQDANSYRMTVEERRGLASGLDVFLRSNPARTPKYRKYILTCMRSRSEDVCVAGLALAGLLDDLAPGDLDFIRQKLTARSPYPRMNALNAFARMLRRPERLAPHVFDYVRSVDLVSQVKKMRRGDRDDLVRLCARNLVQAWRDHPLNRHPAPRVSRRREAKPAG